MQTWKNKIQTATQSLNKETYKVDQREFNKDIALGTSKLNYMDPRITVTWCKNEEVPIEKVFSQTLRNKFGWAMQAKKDWEF
jgi:DNA topoisomerase-1